MATKQIRPYGTWISPVTSEAIVSETVDMADIRLDGYDVYWTETRPKEGGRITVMWRSFNGQLAEMVPEPYNVRSRVHEYGGGAYTVYNGTVIFANFSDQRLYKIEPGADPEPITPEGDVRYADFTIDRSRSRLICVAEDHSGSGSEPTNSLVAIPLSGDGAITRLASGGDFYANPRVNPEDSLITWLAWDHPNMPWDETGLWVAELKGDGSIGLPVMVTGGDGESIFQPHWSPTGILHFVSDRTGWWNLYACLPEGITQLFEIKGDIACAQWKLGASTYGFESSENIVLTYTQRGLWYLSLADAKSGDLRSLVTRYTNISSIQAAPGMAVFIGSSPARAPALVQLDLTVIQEQELRQSSSVEIDSTCISAPEHIQFPSSGGRTAYAFYYPPANGDFEPPPGELPPLIVHCHGGPTGAASSSLDLEKQFWTSRGLAILDVNYGGSTGFGRDYRYLLHGKWGIVDVEDCIAGAHYLVQRGLVDEKRMAISGGSAGGYTVLCALTFHNTFLEFFSS